MNPEKKKKWKKKLFRSTKGAISILLCLVMAPFLSIGLALVEYARYQQVFELVDELEELTGISIISEYDQYIHNRFGLLSVSQNQDMNSIAEEFMLANMGALGSQANLNKTTVNGKLPLSNTDVAKKQILDAAELTGLGHVLMEDFNIELLKEKLLNLGGVTSAINTVNNMADMTAAMGSAVDTAEKLTEKLEKLQEALSEDAANSIIQKANTLTDQVYTLFESLVTKGYTIPDTLEGEEWDEILLSATGEYEEQLKSIYTTAKEIIDQVGEVKTLITEIPPLVTQLEADVKKVSECADKIAEQDPKSTEGKLTEGASETLENIAEQLENIVKESLNDIKEDALKTIQDAVNEIVDTALDSIGLADAYARYSAILDGTYFESDVGKQDLKTLISLIPEVWNTQSPDAVFQSLKEMLIPDIDFDLSILTKLASSIGGIVDKAKDHLKGNADEKGFDMLVKLVNVINGLFSLTGLYDPKLNSKVTLSGVASSPYQTFLEGLSTCLTAVKDFVKAMASFNFFEAIEALGKLFEGFGKFFEALIELVENMVKNISSVFKGGINGLYERLLIAGYAVHNFPNRTNNTNQLEADYNGALSTTRLELSGEGLTGFSYNQIARPATYAAQNIAQATGVASLTNILNGLFGPGTDTMFKGAMVEYVVAGTSSELANQIVCFFNLYFIRLLCSLPAVFMDLDVQSTAAACNIACWVVYILYAVIEPFCDCLLLVNNATVPIVKTGCFLTASNIGDFITKLGEACMSEALLGSINEALGTNEQMSSVGTNKSSGTTSSSPSLLDEALEVDYSSHLLIALLIGQDENVTTKRIQELIRLEAAEYYRQKNVKFNWSKTYTSVIVTADIDVNSFFDLGIMSGSDSVKINSKKKQPVSY